jgi:DNA-binding SARP family transcriptional activator
VRLQVLGPTRLLGDGGAEQELGARKQRSVLAALALHRDQDVAAGTVVDLVWGGQPPGGAHGTLHSYISGLRRRLGAVVPEAGELLATTDHGYRLRLDREQVDADLFAAGIGEVHRQLAPLAGQFRPGAAAGWPAKDAVAAAVQALEEALAQWRGEPYADLPDHPDLDAARGALREWRTTAELDRALGLLALGDHATCAAATEQLVVQHPLRERTWALHALALSRLGRPADALGALRGARQVLADELGLDPGAELQELEQTLLRQDPLAVPPLPAAPASASSPRVPAPRPERPAVGWPTVGRELERALLRSVLEDVLAGRFRQVQLVGEAGIGKSHLVADLVEQATARGFAVAVGPCSPDDSAPPLWPWRTALEQLGIPAGVLDGSTFEDWEALVAALAARVSEGPVLLVLEDLHWADSATLRALRHLADRVADTDRLLLAITRRPYPEPSGELDAVLEAMARRHAEPVLLGALSPRASAALVTTVAGAAGATSAAGWHDRAAGNPYFLIELARLAGTHPDPAGVVPPTVLDVVQHRVRALPEETRALLVTAAVLGQRFPLDLLAAVERYDDADIDAALGPARDAGLVRDIDASHSTFAHALTRDAVAATATPSRVQRLHARVAHAIEQGGAPSLDRDQQVSELARHWVHAGPSHAARAWRAAVAAAAQARARFARAEASTWMTAALDAHPRDPSGTPAERIELLLTAAHDRQVDGEWTEIHALVAEAVALARSADDPAGVVRAAAADTRDSVWLSLPWFEVDEDVVDDLRWALRRLPGHDSADRCRGMLALAAQLYYDPAARAEAEALAEEGMALARRLDDPDLTWWAARTAVIAWWRPAEARRRRALSLEGLEAARLARGPESEPVALVVAAGDALEAGDRSAYDELVAEAERVCRRRHNEYALLALGWMRLSLAAMRSDDDLSAAWTAELMELGPRRRPEYRRLTLGALGLSTGLWAGGLEALVEPMRAATDAIDGPMGRDVVLMALARAGAEDLVERQLRTPIRHPIESWNTSSTAACIAEAASYVGHRAEATRARDLLLPAAGQFAIAGYSVVHGPADGYRALAHATLGEHAAAVRAADDATALAEQWELVRYLDWLGAHRRRLGV